MNAKYYEYVNEKKKKKFIKSGRSRTYNLLIANQLLYHLHHHIPLHWIKSFILKVNHAQKHTTSKCWGVRWEPWTFGFPVFRSTT
jgi:hypothetical protein